jgi:TetR/AcrR family transcriptional regulator
MAGGNKNRPVGEGENLLDKFQARPTFLNLPEEKKDRIIARATREFSEKGYQGASINTLVDDLGISKGSIFQYFTSKKGLFLFIFQAAVERVRRTLVGVKEETEDLEFFERIRRSILAGVDFVRRHPQIYRIYLKLLFDREAPYRAELLKAIRLFSAEYLGSLVEKGLERGEIRKDIPPEQAVFILDAVLDRYLQAYMVPFLDQGGNIYQGNQDQVAAWAGGIVEILRKGLQG